MVVRSSLTTHLCHYKALMVGFCYKRARSQSPSGNLSPFEASSCQILRANVTLHSHYRDCQERSPALPISRPVHSPYASMISNPEESESGVSSLNSDLSVGQNGVRIMSEPLALAIHGHILEDRITRLCCSHPRAFPL